MQEPEEDVRNAPEIESGKISEIASEAIFERDSIDLIRPQGPRRRGRPRKHWVNEVYKIAEGIAGSKPNLANMLSQVSWERAVKEYCSNTPYG